MVMDRRTFLTGAGTVGIGAALGCVPGHREASQTEGVASPKSKSSVAPKRLLILGGTGFIGPPMVRYAVERGHDVTIFTRGRSNVELPDVEHLVGDRSGDLDALRGRTWDVVLDNNARDYRWVKLTTNLLKEAAGQYIFVSSISAYAGEAEAFEYFDEPWAGPQINVDSPLVPRPAGFEDGQDAEYGLTKALSEELVRGAFPGRNTVVRPGYIVGPGDPTDRFTYWPVRIDRGGEVLAPGDGSDPVQIIDVRDLTEWIIRLAEEGAPGTFNGVGPASPMSVAEMLYGIRATTNCPVRFTWVPTKFLRQHEVEPYSDMPIWTPADPFAAVDHSHAVASGLTFRSLATTSVDTLNWHRTRPAEEQSELRTGIKPDREKEVLEAWHRR